MTAVTPPMERFVVKFTVTETCWVWHAAKSAHGYGKFWSGERLVTAHRWLYEQTVGSIPEGLVLDHLCRNPSCVNPDHLEPVTQRENLLRGDTFAADQSRRTQCPRGHEYTEANTMRWRNLRKCRICHNTRRREEEQRKRAEKKRVAA